jgi:cobalt-precorrin-7 (C5)-methyltransferase
MKIVGVGAGPGMITLEAIEAIRSAKLIYGSERAIALAADHIPLGCDVRVIRDYRSLRSLPDDAVVLSTGDPMLSGLGYLGGDVIPGISSMQVACARLGLSLLRVVPITFHGRKMDPEAVAFELEHGRGGFLLADDSTDLDELCRYLEDRGIHRDVVVLRDLGYPEERINVGTTRDPPEARGLFSVVIGELR